MILVQHSVRPIWRSFGILKCAGDAIDSIDDGRHLRLTTLTATGGRDALCSSCLLHIDGR